VVEDIGSLVAVAVAVDIVLEIKVVMVEVLVDHMLVQEMEHL
jgi:hypothetical protein